MIYNRVNVVNGVNYELHEPKKHAKVVFHYRPINTDPAEKSSIYWTRVMSLYLVFTA